MSKVIPIKTKKETGRIIIKSPQLYLYAFTWNEKEFINIETGDTEKGLVWRPVGNVSLNATINKGRKIIERRIQIDEEGKRRSKPVIVGRHYGYEGIADILSTRYPCTPEEAKRLVQEAKKSNFDHAYFVLESDLVPTDPQTYAEMGKKNQWLIMSSFPSWDKVAEKLNETLKAQGSPLRVKSKLKWIIRE